MVVVFLQTKERWWKGFFFFFTFEDIPSQILHYHFLFVTGEWKLLLWSAEIWDARVCLGRHRCDRLSAVKMRSLFSAVSPNFLKGHNRAKPSTFSFFFHQTPFHLVFCVLLKIHSAVNSSHLFFFPRRKKNLNSVLILLHFFPCLVLHWNNR